MDGALAGVRILDLSRILAGPWATQLLADLGADVIKVEHPDGGDETRRWTPPALEGESGYREAAYFLCANRGKQSICIDIANPEGQRLVRALAATCDVVVENFKVGGLTRYGLDAATLRGLDPRLIYCSITGFGQDGPRARQAGYDFMVQALGGLMSVTGEAGGPPLKVGVALADVMTGLYAANAISAALLARERTGHGQVIDVALFDVQLATLANQALNFLVSGRSPAPRGNVHPNIAPYESFYTADREIVVAVGSDRQFAALCRVLAAPELIADPRYASNDLRVVNRDALAGELNSLFYAQASAELLPRLEAAGVPAAPINDLAEAFADPQAQHRGTVLSLAHPGLGTAPGVACPVRLSETPVAYRRAPPMLGEHGDAILAERLHLSGREIHALKAAGVVGAVHERQHEGSA